MKLLSQNRIMIPIELYRSLVPLEVNALKVYFFEKKQVIIFSNDLKNEDIVQLGEVSVDYKHRIILKKYLLDLIGKLLHGDLNDLYFCVNQNHELCIKRVPQ